MTTAAVRPHDWNLPLFLHVLGAMALVGLLATAIVVLVVSLRGTDRAAALRLAFRTLLWGALPAYLVMRVCAEWIKSKEKIPDDNPPSWIGIGYSVADFGLLLLIVITVLTALAARRARRDGVLRGGLVRSATALTGLLILAYAVALWAMATKPT